MMIGLCASKDFTKAISFFKNSLSVQGHSPKGKKGSFSTCQYLIESAFRYLKIIFSINFKILSCWFSFSRFLAQSGIRHSGQRPVFTPTTKRTSTFASSAVLISQSKSLKRYSPASGSIISHWLAIFILFTPRSSIRAE